MRVARTSFSLMLVAALIASGCQTEARPVTVAEYRPCSAPIEKKAPNTGVFVLWRWYPVAPLVPTASTATILPKPIRQMRREVEEVYFRRRAEVGFVRRDGQLIAVADKTTQPLEGRAL